MIPQILQSLGLLKKHPGWLSLLLWIILITPVQAAVELRVAIKKDVSQLQIGSSTPALVRDRAGRKLGEITAMKAVSAQSSSGGVTLGQWRSEQLIIEPTEDGYVWIGNSWYRGRTRLIRQGKGIIAVNQVKLEDYLYSVVGAEAIPSWPQEALKAQAVAARTYALYKVSKGSNRLYDLDSTTTSQVYKGLNSEYISTHDAVNGTTGQVMIYNGKIIMAVFHSSSGGHTENVEDVWSSPLPYLRGVVDYDQAAPVFQWTKAFSAYDITRMIGGVGNIRAMIPERTTRLGRVVSMKIVGDRGSKSLSGVQLRQALDLRSTLFVVSANNGNFQVEGRGYGHGIGLSQWGAYSLAQQGVDYQQILNHYYQNASLSNLE